MSDKELGWLSLSSIASIDLAASQNSTFVIWPWCAPNVMYQVLSIVYGRLSTGVVINDHIVQACWAPRVARIT